MTEQRYLSRVRLRRDAAVSALAPVLVPNEPDARTGVVHRLIWTLFAGEEDRAHSRFLWRDQRPSALRPGRATFFILSSRPPIDHLNLFGIETKAFAPSLAAGDRLGFSLRANPVLTRWNSDANRPRPRRDDVVMARLRPLPREARAAERPLAIVAAGREWLERQGRVSGFHLLDRKPPADAEPDTLRLRIDGYEQLTIPRRGEPMRFSVLDFDGVLIVDDPAAFRAALDRGFGKAKAFGCGLMLIRRA